MDHEKNRITAAERLGAVSEQQRRLDDQLERLATCLDKLESVLGMVLLPAPGARKDDSRPPIVVSLAEQFAKRCDVLDHQITRVCEIIERVSI